MKCILCHISVIRKDIIVLQKNAILRLLHVKIYIDYFVSCKQFIVNNVWSFPHYIQYRFMLINIFFFSSQVTILQKILTSVQKLNSSYESRFDNLNTLIKKDFIRNNLFVLLILYFNYLKIKQKLSEKVKIIQSLKFTEFEIF